MRLSKWFLFALLSTLLSLSGTAFAAGGLVISGGTGGVAISGLTSITGAVGDAFVITNSPGAHSFTGLDIDNPTGDGIALTNNTGSLTATGVDLDGIAVRPIDVNQGTAAISLTLGGTSTNNSDRTVSITNLTGGSCSISGGVFDIDGGTGIHVLSNSGNADIDVDSNLDIDTPGSTAITATSNSGGANIDFGGTSKSLATTTATAVNLGANAGATIGFSGGGLDIDTTTGLGFSVTTSGTVNSSGSGNSITTNTGQPMAITTTSGAISLDLDFDSVVTTGISTQGIDARKTMTGTIAGSVDIVDGTITTNGRGVRLDGTTLNFSYGGYISALTWAAFRRAVEIANHSSGTIVLGGDIVDTAAGSTFLNMSGGSFTHSGSFNEGVAGPHPALDISNCPGGTISFTGNPKVFSTDTVTAITVSNSAGAMVNFTNGGLDLDTTSGAGIFISGGGNVTVSGSGNTIDTVTGSGVSMSSAGGGTVAINSNITSHGAALLADIQNRNGGSVDLSGNLLTMNDIANGVGIRVQNNTAGSVTFSGASKVLNTVNNQGVFVSTNSAGFATNFTNGGLDIDTLAGQGFLANNGGTVTVTGAGNSINTVRNMAMNVLNTTIGASGLNFQSISAGNNTADPDPANGIVLLNTGSSGGLTVTGTGVSGQGGNGSGGTIQNTTDHGISLTSTMNPSFANMSIQNTAGSGINGTSVAGFSFDKGTINNSATGGSVDDSNISFNDSTSNSNVSGAVSVTDSVLTNSRYHGIDIQHYDGTISHANIQNNAFTSAASIATSLGSALRLDAYGNAMMVGNVTRATINNNVIQNFPTGAGIHAFGGNSGGTAPAGTFGVAGSAMDIIAVTNNRMDGGALGVGNQPDRFFTGGVTGSGQGNFNISGNGTMANPITNIDGVVIELNQFGTGTMTAMVNNNFISANNAVGSSGINVGCDADGTAAPDDAVVTATISGNNVSDTDGPGIFAIARGSEATLIVKILNNTVAAPDTTTSARAGIRVDSGSAVGDTTLCLEMTGNNTAGSTNTGTATTSPGINLRKQGTSTTVNVFGIEGLSPSPAGTPDVENHVNSLNTSTSGTFGVNGTALLSAASGFTSCVVP
jgi:hypothetical protein